MAHREQQEFFAFVRATYPSAFRDVLALDCGSLDVNGCLRPLFDRSTYVGVDRIAGPNVDLVGRITELDFIDGAFDTIVSAEMLEHDEEWAASLRTMYRLLRSGGLLALSMATTGRAEHGTASTPHRGSQANGGVWGAAPDYYRNLTVDDLREALDLDKGFAVWSVQIEEGHHDLYFWGLKV